MGNGESLKIPKRNEMEKQRGGGGKGGGNLGIKIILMSSCGYIVLVQKRLIMSYIPEKMFQKRTL